MLESRRLLATIIVNSTADGAPAVDGQLTLREAIEAANTNLPSGDASAGDPGLDTINFNIGLLDGTVKTIAVTGTPLPTISEPLTIDGYTQDDATPNSLAVGSNAVLRIEIDGSGSGSGSVLTIDTDNTTIKGLVINNSVANGIKVLSGSTGILIAGNFIGTNPAGDAIEGNSGDGVDLDTATVSTIGGTTPAAQRDLRQRSKRRAPRCIRWELRAGQLHRHQRRR